MNTTIKCYSKGHEYDKAQATALGCPICLADYLDKGGSLD